MEVKKIVPPINSFLQVKLDQEIIDYLWRLVDEARINNINNKDQLAGNISQSLLLADENYLFFKSVCVPLVNYYRKNNSIEGDPVNINSIIGSKSELILKKLWVNYQYKTEFNPFHDHSGVYSFAIWLRIPYSWQDQKKLPQFLDMEDREIKAGNFEFEYNDSLGGVQNFSYRLSPDLEGYMLFFPAKLRHCVYPFYNIDEPRISIAGNLFYLPS
tara:strand:- start:211 stop:855 length:645 start_codon:yes stop_codon:yes gene_type:complete